MSAPEWKGLFEWSMKYHDGTRPTDFSESEVDPEKLKWLEDALQHYMKDFVERMKEVKTVFDDGENSSATLKEKEALLDELQDIVESVDHARDLHLIGGLTTLLELLESPFPSLCYRAAEVIATCVQNNLPVQQWFLDGGALPPLMNLLDHDDELCCSKGWLAISSLVRNFPDGERAFVSMGGLPKLLNAATGTNEKIKRRTLLLIQYFLRSESRRSSLRLNAAPGIMESLASENPDVREAALMALLELGRDSDGCSQLLKVEGLAGRVSQLLEDMRHLSSDEKEALGNEMELAQNLQQLLEKDSTAQVNCTTLSVV